LNKFVTVNGSSTEWEKRMTVQQLLDRIDYSHRLFVVKMNGRIVKKELYSSLAVPEDAHLEVFPLVSGG
jgi:thiamine biosynthesis protein ThiS